MEALNSAMGMDMDTGDQLVQEDGTRSNRQYDQNNYDKSVFKTFNCSQVSENILKYLSLQDCKELSLCSKLMLSSVRGSNVFAKSACITIDKESWDSGMLSRTWYTWSNVKIELSWLPQESVFTTLNIVKAATCLKLQLTVDPLEKMLERKLNYHLTNILEGASTLKSLYLDPSLMHWILHDTFSNIKVQQCITKLQELHIEMLPANIVKNLGKSKENEEDSDDEEEHFPRNLFQVSLIPTSLQSFSFLAQNDPSEKDIKFNRFVPNIIKRSQKTLIDLTISLDCWTIQAFQSLLFPKLKSLNIQVASVESGDVDVEGIIRNQPLLNNLVLKVCSLSPSLLNSIAARSAKLKILHIQSKWWYPWISASDWSFLSTLAELKEFKLSTETSNMSLVGILEQLPSHVEKLAINGICGGSDEDGDNTIKMIATLTKFPRLTELSLLECRNAVNDDILDHIYYHMKQLTVLEFSDCPNVTDEGLTGVRDDVFMEVSIQDLCGLKRLAMRRCNNLSSQVLQKSIKFAHLRSLDISGMNVSDEEILEIVASNPCLETLVASLERSHTQTLEDQNPFVKYSIKDRIASANPRTQKVQIKDYVSVSSVEYGLLPRPMPSL